jgi:hypothetical protein
MPAKEMTVLPGTALCLHCPNDDFVSYLDSHFCYRVFGIFILMLIIFTVVVVTSLSGAQSSLSQLGKVFGGFFGRLMPALSNARYSTEGFYLGMSKTFAGTYDLTWSFEVREYCFAYETLCLLTPFEIGSLFTILSGLELLHGSSIARWFAKKSNT